jgi:uncharacterized heparinase superfamily protein
MISMQRSLLVLRTARHMTISQILHRIRLRAALRLGPVLERTTVWGGNPSGAMAGWPEGFRALDAGLDHGDPTAMAKGRFAFLGDERDLGEPADWLQLGADRLWRFHLHYFEWAWALDASSDLASARQTFAELWRSWRGSTDRSHRDAWSPYVASLRAWLLCDVHPNLIAGSPIEADVSEALWDHARFIRTHLELDVGGNHLLKNLKALVGLGVFLGESDLVELADRHVKRQLPVQIMPDGGHFERSPSYHCQVLGDLLDVRELLAASGRPKWDDLDQAISRMRRWLGAVLAPDGSVPLVNDSVPVSRDRLARLQPDPTEADALTVLASTGYVVVRPEQGTQLLIDVGDPCPDELPAHAHADCLSFLLWVHGEEWIVDTGTSTYEPGPRREYERSTTAHNTVEIDGLSQTEVWGTFRAARRARGRLELVESANGSVEVVASHDGYRRLPSSPVHRRRWVIRPGQVRIIDSIERGAGHQIVGRLHFTAAGSSRVDVQPPRGRVSWRSEERACGFNQRTLIDVLRVETNRECDRPEIEWTVTWS